MALSAKRLGTPQKPPQPPAQPPAQPSAPGSEVYNVPRNQTPPPPSSTPSVNSPELEQFLRQNNVAEQQNAAKEEIDSFLSNLIGDGNGAADGINLSDTLIPQAAQAELETTAKLSDPLGGFILPGKKGNDNPATGIPTVEIAVPPAPEPTVKIPMPPPAAQPAVPAPKPVPSPTPVTPKDAKRKAETWTPKSGNVTVNPGEKGETPSSKAETNSKTKTAPTPAGKTKQSSLPAVIVLILLVLLAGYVVYAYILPAFSETENKNDAPKVKPVAAEKATPAAAIEQTVEVIETVKERNSAKEEPIATQAGIPAPESQGPEISEDSQTLPATDVAEEVAPSAAPAVTKPKKKKVKEEVIDIPFDDDELPPEYQPLPWPEIMLTAVIAKGKKGDGFATVNGETLRVGDETSDGVKLVSVAVNPPRAVLKFDGREQTVLVSHKGE